MTQLTRFYIYKLQTPEGPVTLSLTIGNAQSATTSLYMDGAALLTNKRDSFSFDIPATPSLSGKELDVSTTVLDVSTQSDNINFRIKLSGGQAVLNPPGDTLRVEPNGVAYILIKVIFV